MLCPNCHAGCIADDIYCRRCGTDLTLSSKSVVSTKTHLPALLQNTQLPRLAASVGALALGVGLELLRRRLIARVPRVPHSASRYVPAPRVDTMQEIFSNHDNQPLKLPKGYEIHETVVYFKRVIRREV
ncbi:MAG TPA: hypothetical protein VEH81_00405 [Ktedonobacteraceae bacterium]|nr:hypothetical protein [Ktedonobacteraceae bacterium]